MSDAAPAVEATATEAAPPESSHEPGTVGREDAIAFLKEEGELGDETGEDTGEPAPKEPAKKKKDPKEGESEDPKDEPEDDDEEAKDDEEKSEDDPDKDPAEPKKESTYRRMKRKLEDTSKERDTLRVERDQHRRKIAEWESFGPRAVDELKAKDEEIATLRSRLEGHGERYDPRDDEVATLRRELQAVKADQEQRAELAKLEQQQAQEQQLSARRSQILGELEDASEKHGLDIRVLAAALKSAKDIEQVTGIPKSIDQVAQDLAELEALKGHRAAQRQSDASQAAPRPVRGTGAPIPRHAATTEGAKAYLTSLGIPLSE